MADSSKEKLHIKLHAYDTDISVFCKPEDEQYYRRAAKRITNTVNEYANRYKGKNNKGDTDILYMALIDIAFRYEKTAGRNDTEPFNAVLSKLTAEIEEAMK